MATGLVNLALPYTHSQMFVYFTILGVLVMFFFFQPKLETKTMS